jgi:hypothetical protein
MVIAKDLKGDGRSLFQGNITVFIRNLRSILYLQRLLFTLTKRLEDRVDTMD